MKFMLAGGLASVLLLCTLGGCNRSQEGTDPAAAARGSALFASNNCARCHALNGQGGGPRAVDLSQVGAQRTADWIVAHLRNPQQHNPQSRMPKFEGRIPDADLQALGGYLAGLK